jgi:hypothetical protein
VSERWRDVPGYVGMYEVSSAGRVRGVTREGSDGRRVPGRMMTQFLSGSGYWAVTLSSGRQRKAYVHRLVLTAFRGRCPKSMEGHHRDGDRSNNSLGNLKWGTHIVNVRTRTRQGRSLCNWPGAYSRGGVYSKYAKTEVTW